MLFGKQARVKGSKVQYANPTFAIRLQAQHIEPFQQYREVVQNAIEAEASHIWGDIDPVFTREYGVRKLGIFDNGFGMTTSQMEHILPRLAETGKSLALDGNFGMGARLATIRYNPFGVVWRSYRDGVGTMFWLHIDADGDYAVRPIEVAPGEWEETAVFDSDAAEDFFPLEILEAGHGTIVTLLGETDDHDTLIKPHRQKYTQAYWLNMYLNDRYFRFPPGVRIQAPDERKDKEGKTWLNAVRGKKHYLDALSRHHGSSPIDGATIHWWLLKKRSEGGRGDDRGARITSHVGVLWRGEIYEKTIADNTKRQLHELGIGYGESRVVVYIEPDADIGIESEVTRQELRLEGERVYRSEWWKVWTAQFANNLPTRLAEYVESQKNNKLRDSTSGKGLREFLQHYKDLLKLQPRFRESSRGETPIGEASLIGGIPRENQPRPDPPEPNPHPGGEGGTTGKRYGAFNPKGSARGQNVRGISPPTVEWISANPGQLDTGAREDGYLEDQGGEWLGSTETLRLNADFAPFRALVEFAQRENKSADAIIIEGYVREQVRNNMVEYISTVPSLNASSHITQQEVENMYSPLYISAAMISGRALIADEVKQRVRDERLKAKVSA